MKISALQNRIVLQNMYKNMEIWPSNDKSSPHFSLYRNTVNAGFEYLG